MADVAHVRLVDAHAKGDGRHHHHAIGLHELILMRHSHVGFEACVIRNGAMTLQAQHLGQTLGALARAAIDDAGLALVSVDEVGDLPGRALLALHGQMQVRPVEGAHESRRLATEQLGDDLVARRRIGGRGDGNRLDVAQRLDHVA